MQNTYLGSIFIPEKYVFRVCLCVAAPNQAVHPGGHWYFKLDIVLVKGLSKHTLNTYFSGMKIDPKYVILHIFS